MRRRFVIVLLALAACSDEAAEIDALGATRVTVTNIDHKPVAVLSAKEDLRAFNKLWLERRSTGMTTRDTQIREFQYFLDVRLPSGSGARWLYSINGLTAKLDHKALPVYQISDLQAFNQLMGIKK